MPSDYFKVGLIVPSSNTVMEPDFHRRLGANCAISTDRIYLEDVTREAEERMIADELPRALRLINTTAPHVIVFGCTSAGSLDGLDGDAALARRIEQATGVRAVTVVGSVLEQLRQIRPQRLAVFTPYDEDLTDSVARCMSDAGYDVAKAAGMGIRSNREIGRVTPEEIAAFVAGQIDHVAVDCIFLSCTNWQAVDAIAAIAARLGLPVISSNQATIDAVRSLSSPGGREEGTGSRHAAQTVVLPASH